jgi:hypothetical protein
MPPRIALLAFAAVPLFVGPAPAQEPSVEEGIEAIRDEIRGLTREAQALDEAGRFEEAAQVRARIRALFAEIEAQLSESSHAISQGGEGLRESLDRIERGAQALREIGRAEEASRLELVAEEIRERIRAEARAKGGGGEDRASSRRLELMETAMHALRDGGRGDSAEEMRRAIRARELLLEGRDDDEARRLRAAAPNEGDQVELLRFAARILQELNEPEKAAAVRQLAEEIWRGWDRPAPARGVRAGDFREARARRDREAQLETALERLDRLEEKVSGIEKAIEELRAALPGQAKSNP